MKVLMMALNYLRVNIRLRKNKIRKINNKNHKNKRYHKNHLNTKSNKKSQNSKNSKNKRSKSLKSKVQKRLLVKTKRLINPQQSNRNLLTCLSHVISVIPSSTSRGSSYLLQSSLSPVNLSFSQLTTIRNHSQPSLSSKITQMPKAMKSVCKSNQLLAQVKMLLM